MQWPLQFLKTPSALKLCPTGGSDLSVSWKVLSEEEMCLASVPNLQGCGTCKVGPDLEMVSVNSPFSIMHSECSHNDAVFPTLKNVSPTQPQAASVRQIPLSPLCSNWGGFFSVSFWQRSRKTASPLARGASEFSRIQ